MWKKPMTGLSWLRRRVRCYGGDDAETDMGGGEGLYSDTDETIISGGRGGGGRWTEDTDETKLRSEVEMGEEEVERTEIEIPETGLMGLLWIKEGQRRGTIYKVRDDDIVGRQSSHNRAEIILSDPKVSSPHARFRVEKNSFVLWDCGSRNGTFVNGTRIRSATTLAENDLIKIGETVFVLKILK